jgi:hypothetical protein
MSLKRIPFTPASESRFTPESDTKCQRPIPDSGTEVTGLKKKSPIFVACEIQFSLPRAVQTNNFGIHLRIDKTAHHGQMEVRDFRFPLSTSHFRSRNWREKSTSEAIRRRRKKDWRKYKDRRLSSGRAEVVRTDRNGDDHSRITERFAEVADSRDIHDVSAGIRKRKSPVWDAVDTDSVAINSSWICD